MLRSILKNLTLSGCVLLFFIVGPARPEVIVSFSQVGSNVVALGTGTIDTAALTPDGTGSHNPNVTPGFARVSLGPSGTTEAFDGISGPITLGSGAAIL